MMVFEWMLSPIIGDASCHKTFHTCLMYYDLKKLTSIG